MTQAPLESPDPTEARTLPRPHRELYLDAFRGLMALVMVQGHVCDTLLSPAARAEPWYQFQILFHGSTAPGFLFASGFVAGLPRSPLSVTATWRRARRLLFILGVGYALHLPYASFWKSLLASPAEAEAFLACNALQAIAVSQIGVLLVQSIAGRRWPAVTAALTVAVVAAGPLVGRSHVAAALPPALGAYVDASTGSPFPLFPFSAFVLAGTTAGALLGRQDPSTRQGRSLRGGLLLLGLGGALALPLRGVVDFWTVSPAYVFIRLGGLLLLLRGVEWAVGRGLPGLKALALLGRETLTVYVAHLYLLYGGIVGAAPLGDWAGRLGFREVLGVLALMAPALWGLARGWHAAKARAPREAALAVRFATVAFLFEFLTRPW